MKGDNLSAKQAMFVREYLKDLNASQAYLRAGYKTKNPDVMSNQLMVKSGVKEAIQRAMDKRAAKVEVSAEYVLENIKEVGERCLQRVPVMVGQGKDRKQAQEWVTDPNTGERVLVGVWQFDASGALKAQELLGKHLKLFTEKVEHSGKVTLESILDGTTE